MKKVEANRYPHSATLFKFCKEALEIRYQGNVKVIDQDVGAILGYDPADCSHWKKGKKNIRALGTLRSIAEHLSIDERLLIDIASGKVGLEEAVFEYKGYGHFSLSGKNQESLKKEFFKNPAKWQQDGNLRSFEELFDVNRETVVRIARSVLDAGRFKQAPIYLPEVFQMYPSISLTGETELDNSYQVDAGDEGKVHIRYQGPEMRPYVRFLSSKELYKYLTRSDHVEAKQFRHSPAEVIDIQANIFAGMILIPSDLLAQEVAKIDHSLDVVSQLADVFWTSKALMNQRLQDYLINKN